MRSILLTIGLIFLMSCYAQQGGVLAQSQQSNKADKIIAKCMEAHGGDRYDRAHYSFVFRGKTYEFKNDQLNYSYKMTKTKDGITTVDVLDNHGLKRLVDGKSVILSERENTGYSKALNSVIYFATLPYKLKDKAVNKSYVGTETIMGKNYEVVQITFNEEGGGADHDDTFYYWINKEDYIIDFLAYNYTVNKGGVRFRTANNRRIVDGIVFQDYVNYKAEVGTPLADLPKLWEKGALKELSKIDTENVQKR